MKKIIFFILFLIIISQLHAQETITIAYFNVPPHVIFDTESKKIVGGALYKLLENHIAPLMRVKFQWDRTPSNIPRQMISLKKEQVDAIALLIFTPDRAKTYVYTKTPYIASMTAIAVLNTSKLRTITKVEDILHLKIGYATKTYLSPFMRDKRIKFDLISTPNFTHQNFQKLLKGRLTGVYAPDKANLLMTIKEMNLGKKVRLITLPERKGNTYVVFSKRNVAMAERFSKAFDEIDGRKKYIELLNEYLDVSRL